MPAVLLTLLTLLAGCMKKPAADAEAVAPSMLAVAAALDPGLVGTWDLSGSTTAWTITAAAGGAAAVSGIDDADGERFEVSGVRPDGRTLRFVARMPSTDHTTVQTWTLTEAGRCAVLIASDDVVTLTAARR